MKSGIKKNLITDAVPSIFEKRVIADSNEIIGYASQAKNQCAQCPFLLQKVADLEKQIFTLNVQHDISVQQLQRQIDLLKNKNEQKVDQVRLFQKELTLEKKQIVRLKDVIAELKSENFISTEDEKILNVRLLVYRLLFL